MAKYVKCVDNSRNTGSLTIGKTYESFSFCATHITLEDDNGDVRQYQRNRFQDVDDNRVIFTSQEGFENAVMEVVLKRLGVQTLTFDKWGRELTEQYSKSAVYDTLEEL